MDYRDDLTWVAVELSRLGEQKIEMGTLGRFLCSQLGVGSDYPIFIPATMYTKGNRSITIHLMEGYVFVGSGLPEVEYFALENTPYVNSVISQNSEAGIRTLSTITNDYVLTMRRQLREMASSNIKIGMGVKVLEGTYIRLEGEVVGLQEDLASVYFEMRSIRWVTDIPRVSLEHLEHLTRDIAKAKLDPETPDPETPDPEITEESIVKKSPTKALELPGTSVAQAPSLLGEGLKDHLLNGISQNRTTTINGTLQETRQELDNAIQEARQALLESPMTAIIHAKLGSGEIIEITPQGEVVVRSIHDGGV